MTDDDGLYIEFTVHGNASGHITSNLDVQYDGMASTEIHHRISTYERENEAESRRKLLEEIVIDLPADTAVTAAEIREAPVIDT